MSVPDEYTSFVVEPDETGRRADVFLARHLPEYSRSQLQKLFDNGAVEVDGEARSEEHTSELSHYS